MPVPLLAEGGNLSELLAKIEAVYGDSAQVVRQDVVRRGGVGGFFAREVHRVVYLVDEVRPGGPGAVVQRKGSKDAGTAPAAPAATDLSAAAPAGQQHHDMTPHLVYGKVAADLEQTAPDAPDVAEPPSFEDLINQADSEEQTPAAPSTPQDDFARILGLIQSLDHAGGDSIPEDMAAQPVAETPAPERPRGGAQRLAARTYFSPFSGREMAFDDAAAAPSVPPAAPSVLPPVAPSVVPPAASAVAQPVIKRAESAPVVPGIDEVRPALPTTLPEAFAPLNPPAIAPSSAPVSAPAPASAQPSEPAAQDEPPAPMQAPRNERLDLLLNLRSVGVPVEVNPSPQTETVFEAVESIVRELPAARELPRGAGEVIAVVGDLASAATVVRAITERLRLTDTAVWYAGAEGHPASLVFGTDKAVARRSVNAVAQIPALRGTIAKLPSVGIVLIATDGPSTDPDDPWAASLLAALQPTMTIAVVDATRKTEDSQRWLDSLGPVDALAVHSARRTSSPASVWELGAPVCLLDGRPAIDAEWFSLLMPLMSRQHERAHTRGA